MPSISLFLQRWTSSFLSLHHFIFRICSAPLTGIFSAPNTIPSEQLLLQSFNSAYSYLYPVFCSLCIALLSAPNTIPPDRLLLQSFRSVYFDLYRNFSKSSSTLRSTQDSAPRDRLLSQSSSLSFFSLHRVALRSGSTLLYSPNIIPPDRLILHIFKSSFSLLRMASTSIFNIINPPTTPKVYKGFLDLPLDIKKKILAYNSDEQMAYEMVNQFDNKSFFSIGHDPVYVDEPAPKSVWSLARVCKQLMDEFFPLLPESEEVDAQDRRQIKQKLLRYSAVSIRQLEDIYDVSLLFRAAGLLCFLPVIRLWMICSFDAVRFFLLDLKERNVKAFIRGLHACWPNLVRLDVVPMVYPPYDDTRWDRTLQQLYDVPRYTWLLEQVRDADALPCLAERHCRGVLWRSFCWTSFRMLKPDPEPRRDHWGFTAKDYEYNELEDGYY